MDAWRRKWKRVCVVLLGSKRRTSGILEDMDVPEEVIKEAQEKIFTLSHLHHVHGNVKLLEAKGRPCLPMQGGWRMVRLGTGTERSE